MSAEVTLDVAREAILVLITYPAQSPIFPGLVWSQGGETPALTQLQEMTLAFVPKILAIFLVVVLTLPFMLATLATFTAELYGRIAGLG